MILSYNLYGILSTIRDSVKKQKFVFYVEKCPILRLNNYLRFHETTGNYDKN